MNRLTSHALSRVPRTVFSRYVGLHVSTTCQLVSKTQPETGMAPPIGDTSSEDAFPSLDFRNTEEAYRSKTGRELVRAYTIFQMCSINVFLRNQRKLLGLTRRLFGRTIFRKVMRMTIYGQFVAGEKRSEVLRSAEKHHYFGIRPMFAYTASEGHGEAGGLPGEMANEALWQTNYDALRDAISLAKASIVHQEEMVKLTFKLTFLGAVQTLNSVTSLIDANTKLVTRMLTDHPTDAVWGRVYDCLVQSVTSDDNASMKQVALETGLPVPRNFPDLDWRSLTTCLAFHVALSRNTHLSAILKELEVEGVSHVVLTDDEEQDLVLLWKKMDDLSQRSSENDVCPVIDAEQTYLQLAIDLMSLDLMRRHNIKRPVVHNTYQCYLTRTYEVIRRDLSIAEAEGFQLGIKVVRGGYMDEERRLAAEQGYPDPVNPTYDATTDMYYRVAMEIINNIQKGTKLQVTFATHNEDTVKYLLERLREMEISLDPNLVAFAQLLGMRDHVAFILGQAGLPANKLLHYGCVEDCVAYLSRRIAENSSGLPTADVERTMLGREIRRRLRAFTSAIKPST